MKNQYVGDIGDYGKYGLLRFLAKHGICIEVMRNNADYAEHAADLLMVNKYLERIGDHATNIAEWVIFSIDDHVNEKA